MYFIGDFSLLLLSFAINWLFFFHGKDFCCRFLDVWILLLRYKVEPRWIEKIVYDKNVLGSFHFARGNSLWSFVILQDTDWFFQLSNHSSNYSNLLSYFSVCVWYCFDVKAECKVVIISRYRGFTVLRNGYRFEMKNEEISFSQLMNMNKNFWI